MNWRVCIAAYSESKPRKQGSRSIRALPPPPPLLLLLLLLPPPLPLLLRVSHRAC
jgi:hypothetical protein